MKKIIGLLLAVVICGFSISAYAQEEIRVMLNDKYLSFDVSPQIINNRTMVPLRAIFEALGASVDWNNDTKTVTSTKGDTTVSLAIDSNIMRVNNRIVVLDSPACIINDRTLVPIRAISEAYGAEVDWNDTTKTAMILLKPQTPIAPQPEDGTPGKPESSKPTVTTKPTDTSESVITTKPSRPDTYWEDSDRNSNKSNNTERLMEEYDRHETAIEEINNDYKDYKKIIDNKIAEIRNETRPLYASESEYNSTVSKKTSEIANLQMRINQLSLDDSRSAQAEKNSLSSELSSLQEELEEYQERYAAQNQIDSLEKMLDDYEEKCNERKAEENALHQKNLRNIRD